MEYTRKHKICTVLYDFDDGGFTDEIKGNPGFKLTFNIPFHSKILKLTAVVSAAVL